ncbi:MAG: hypothetical protein H0X35_13025 [Pseudonocardiales bacterium]|nr:hypothetical protein [Pseudonocardiales bacterium]
MARPDPELPLMFTRADARTAGFSAAQASRRAAGDWIRLRQGWFTTRSDLAEETRWRAEILATVSSHRRPLVLSHAHAARAYRWPRPLGGWGPASFTSGSPPRRHRSGSWINVADLQGDDVRYDGQVAVTAPGRTVVDCARRLPARDALAIADAAMRQGVPRDAVRAALVRQEGWPGIAKARRVLALADGRRETAFESWSAWAFGEQGVRQPLWQATLLDREGVHLGRADALWEKEGVVGEADGRAKYRLKALERRGVVDAEGLAAALDDERRRERDLRAAGAVIVRWEPGDVLTTVRARRLAEQLQRELTEAGRARRFTGRVILL